MSQVEKPEVTFHDVICAHLDGVDYVIQPTQGDDFLVLQENALLRQRMAEYVEAMTNLDYED